MAVLQFGNDAALIVQLIRGRLFCPHHHCQSISKFHQKKWGKTRIKTELKSRNISEYLIAKSLKEITDIDYINTFEELSQKIWDTIIEKNDLKKRKKFCDTLLRKGWENHRVYDKVIELEKTN